MLQIGVDYIGVGVGALLVNPEGKIFLSQRGPKARNQVGKWEIPGGKVEFGATLENTIIREAKEEFGIEIEIIKLLDVKNDIIPEEKQHWVSPTYLCKIVKGSPQICEPEKCSQIGWFTLEEARKMPLSIVTKLDLEYLFAHPQTITQGVEISSK